jgi:hypothetical protein
MNVPSAGAWLRLAAACAIVLLNGGSPRELKPLVRISNGGLSRHVIESVPPGLHWFGMTAVNADGIESRLSNLTSTIVE